MFKRRFLSVFVVSALFSVASPHLRAAAEECPAGSGFGAWKLPMTAGGHGAMLGRLFDPADSRNSLLVRGDLVDEPIECLTCIHGTIRGYLDDGHGGPPRYAVEGTYESSIYGDVGQFDLRVIPLDGTTTVGKIRGEFESPRALGLRGRFHAEWRIC